MVQVQNNRVILLLIVGEILRFRPSVEIKNNLMIVLKKLLFYCVVCLLTGVSLMGQDTNRVDLNS